jgi:hypothetical protein
MLTFALFRRLTLRTNKQKHTNLPINSLEITRKEGWYGYHNYCIDMDGYNPTLFAGFYCSNRPDFSSVGYRLGPLHRSANHIWHTAICRPPGHKVARCISPFLSNHKMDSVATVENTGDTVGENLLSQRHYPSGHRRHPLLSCRPTSRWRFYLARPYSFHLQCSLRPWPESVGPYAANISALGWRTHRPACQYAAATQGWSQSHRPGSKYAYGNDPMAAGTPFFVPLRRFLHSPHRSQTTRSSHYLANEKGCNHLRPAAQTRQAPTRSAAGSWRQASSASTVGRKHHRLEGSQDRRTGQEKKTSGLEQDCDMVSRFPQTCTAGHQPGPRGQGKRRLFGNDRHRTFGEAGCWWLC